MRLQAIAPFFLLVTLILAGCSNKEPEVDTTKDFQGAWQTMDSDKLDKKLTVVFEKDVVEIHEMRGSESAIELGNVDKAQFRVNLSETPHHIELVYIEGKHAGMERKGIAAFEGSKLKMCIANLGVERPTTFTASESCQLLLLERKK